VELVKDWGGSVPKPEARPEAQAQPKPDPVTSADLPEETFPADPEVVPPETDAPVAMGPDVAPELSEAETEAVLATKSKAAECFSQGKFEDAVAVYTEVLQKMPSALTYAKRAEAFVKLKKNKAAIRDCDAALALNPDSAKAYKTRGIAFRFLGEWESANMDLAKGLGIDFDETTAGVQKVVAERYKAIRAAKLKKEADARDAEKAERAKRAEDARRAREEAARSASAGMGGMGGMGGFPGMGGMGGMGGGMPNLPPELLGKLMSDPSLMQAMQNPKIMAALQECMGNPAAFAKYQSDPEIMDLVTKLGGLMGGSMPAGFGGRPHGGPSSAGFEDVTDATGGASVEDVD